jgi:hypothetical protein
MMTSDWRTTIDPDPDTGWAYLNDAPPDDMVSPLRHPGPPASAKLLFENE